MTDQPQIEEETAPPLDCISSASFLFAQLPKLLASAPIVLAILGICYDVGFFYGIGLELFPLFSLSEHLVFAMEAVPVLIFLVVAFIWLAGFIWTWVLRSDPRTALQLFFFQFSPKRRRVLEENWRKDVLARRQSAASRLADLLKGFRNYIIFLNVGVPIAGLLVAFGLGFFTSQLEEGEAWSSTVILNDGPSISGRVLRSGERGLLVFNALDGTVQFRPWGDIKRIELPPPMTRMQEQ